MGAMQTKIQHTHPLGKVVHYGVPLVPLGVVTCLCLSIRLLHPSGNSEMFGSGYMPQAESLEFSLVSICGLERGIFWEDAVLGRW